MAGLSDVENALVDLITGALYPSAGAPPSVVGFPVKIYPGWPDAGTLDTDMVETAGKPHAAHVSVYPLPQERNTTRYRPESEEKPAPATTYGLAAAGQVVTVSGAAPAPYVAQNLAVFVNGRPYVTQAAAGATPAQLATALAALIVADVPGTVAAGANVTLPATARVGALRVGSTGQSIRLVRTQEKPFQIGVWSSSPATRALVADTFDPVLADTPRLSMPDGTLARLIYQATREDDFTQKQRIYRRSLLYTVEYHTTLVVTAAQLVAGQVDILRDDGALLSTRYS